IFELLDDRSQRLPSARFFTRDRKREQQIAGARSRLVARRSYRKKSDAIEEPRDRRSRRMFLRILDRVVNDVQSANDALIGISRRFAEDIESSAIAHESI